MNEDLERGSGQSSKACEAFRKSLETWERWKIVGASSFYDREHAAKVRNSLIGCASAGGESR